MTIRSPFSRRGMAGYEHGGFVVLWGALALELPFDFYSEFLGYRSRFDLTGSWRWDLGTEVVWSKILWLVCHPLGGSK